MKHLCKTLLVSLVTFLPLAVLSAADTLEMTVVDTEGGKAIIMLTPAGESMLVDAGFPGNNGRDTKRIVAAAEELKIKEFDYILATHYDGDHVANIASVDAKIPAKVFLDRGPLQPGANQGGIQRNVTTYLNCIGERKRVTLKPGDELPLQGVKVTVFTANGEVIKKHLAGGAKPNEFAAKATKPDIGPQDENAECIGLLYEFGKFRMADFADLLQTQEFALMTPDNPVGTVDLFMVSHHGSFRSNNSVLVHALRPKVAIMNNGARKGGDAITFDTLKASPGLLDLWQLHTSLSAKEKNSPADFIANPQEPCEGKAIKVSVQRDGTFTVTNMRNQYSKTYKP
jgi:beta-lactamase superfamily II metal-dependent hydrolase